jgi:hypothetical protein
MERILGRLPEIDLHRQAFCDLPEENGKQRRRADGLESWPPRQMSGLTT